MLLEIIDEMHLLQPSSNMQVSRKKPGRAAQAHAARHPQGLRLPVDLQRRRVVEEQLRQGKSLEDARAGGCSGCVEVGAFGKEAYILTGYFNLVEGARARPARRPSIRAPAKQLGPGPGPGVRFDLRRPLRGVRQAQLRTTSSISRSRATRSSSDLRDRDDAGAVPVRAHRRLHRQGKDYNAGGARYNNTFIQAVGIGSITDSLAAIRQLVFDVTVSVDARPSWSRRSTRISRVTRSCASGSCTGCPSTATTTTTRGRPDGARRSRRCSSNRSTAGPTVQGRPLPLEMLPTTCHVYFGSVTGAIAPTVARRGRRCPRASRPVQGADRAGPTAVLRSAAKMDHVRRPAARC